MSAKTTSEEAYENLRSVDAGILSFEQFDRQTLQNALDIRANLSEQEFPSAKSFLDWARRYGIVEPVEGSRGLYRWAPSVEEKAAEVGRQIAAGVDPVEPEPDSIVVTDMDPENPMILNLTIDNVPRLPRKMKKRMKRDLTANTSARKVTISFAGADR